MPNNDSSWYLKNSCWLLLSLLVIVADQVSKALAVAHLTPFSPKAILPWLNFTLAHNTGAAFSLLSSAGGWQRWFFIIISIIASFGLTVWLLRTNYRYKLQAISISLIIGGALGNFWDRVALGYVIDFIDVYAGEWHWPVFNIADSAITIGVLSIAFCLCYQKELA